MNSQRASGGSSPPVPGRRGWKVGRVVGVPVYISPSYVVFAVVLAVWYRQLTGSLATDLSSLAMNLLAAGMVAGLFLSVLLHEVGHAVMARYHGIGVRSITIEMLGGYTEMESDSPHPRADLLVSLIGPAVSAVLGLAAMVAWGALPHGTIGGQLALVLAWSNLVVAGFNALPGLPLDGGRALRAVVWAVTGNRHTGTTVAGWSGRILAAGVGLLILFAVAAGRISLVSVIFGGLVAGTLWQGATASINYARMASRLPGLSLRELARPLFGVLAGTPLAEAQRRAAQAVIAVTDSAGRVVALVHDEAAAAVPVPRRPWVPVESVARTLDPGRTLPAELTGEDVIRAVQANPAAEYLVVSGETAVGVLRTADLVRVLNV